MNKYRVLLSLSFQEAIQYRFEAAVWFLYDVLPPLMMVFLWLAAYRETDQVAGYSLGAMLGYYLGVALLQNVLTAHPEWDIARTIRDGTLSMLLLKPLHPWGFWMTDNIAWRFLRLLMVAPILLVAVALLGGEVSGPRLTPESGLALALSLPLAFVLCYFLRICLGFAAFWLLEIAGLIGLVDVLVYLIGGTLVPLELLPAPLRLVADLLPFKYIYYFPLAVALGRIAGAELWTGLALQVAWTAALSLLAHLLWTAGLRRYEAVGA